MSESTESPKINYPLMVLGLPFIPPPPSMTAQFQQLASQDPTGSAKETTYKRPIALPVPQLPPFLPPALLTAVPPLSQFKLDLQPDVLNAFSYPPPSQLPPHCNCLNLHELLPTLYHPTDYHLLLHRDLAPLNYLESRRAPVLRVLIPGGNDEYILRPGAVIGRSTQHRRKWEPEIIVLAPSPRSKSDKTVEAALCCMAVQQRRIARGSALAHWPVHAVFTDAGRIVFGALLGKRFLLSPMLEVAAPPGSLRRGLAEYIGISVLSGVVAGVRSLYCSEIPHVLPAKMADRVELVRRFWHRGLWESNLERRRAVLSGEEAVSSGIRGQRGQRAAGVEMAAGFWGEGGIERVREEMGKDPSRKR